MILIHSHSFDESTNDVIERLLLAGCDILRINEQDVVYLYSMTLDTVIFEVNSLKYTLQDFTTFWHRKESVNFQATLPDDF